VLSVTGMPIAETAVSPLVILSGSSSRRAAMRTAAIAATTAAVIMLAVAGGPASAARLITGREIRNGTVTGADIKNHSLTPADFRGSVRGHPGPQGPAGPTGPQGAAGLASVFAVWSNTVAIAPGAEGGAQVSCPAGTTVLGTGFNAGLGRVVIVERFGGTVDLDVLNDQTTTIVVQAQAICGGGPGVSSGAP